MTKSSQIDKKMTKIVKKIKNGQKDQLMKSGKKDQSGQIDHRSKMIKTVKND